MAYQIKSTRRNRKRKIKGFVIFLIYALTAVVTLDRSLPLSNPSENLEVRNPLDKIDDRLFSLMKDPLEQDTSLDLIILFNTDIEQEPTFPQDVVVKSHYVFIHGVLVTCPVYRIFELAQMAGVYSIWWDTPFESDMQSRIDPYSMIKAASGNMDPTFANFTKEIGATDLWERGYNGSDVIIAVLDAGVDITGAGGGDLDDFDENTTTVDVKYLGGVSMVPEEPLYYTDLNGRGTFHAGIACGTGNLNSSHIGVAPGASYLNVKVYDSIGITYWSFIISGIEWAISHGADILLFATTIPGLYLDPVCLAINNAVDRGLVVITPVGDDGPGYMSINTPGQAHRSISVGAYNSFTGETWNQSSRGPSFDFAVGPDLIAPGVGLIGPRSRIFSAESLNMLSGVNDLAEEFGFSFDYSMDLDIGAFAEAIPKTTYGEEVEGQENYTRSSGTGAAAAVVAGAAAILLAAFPLATPVLIHQALIETSTSITSNQDLNTEGAGLVNVSAAFNWLSNIFTPNEFEIIPLSVPLPYAGVVTSSDYLNMSDYSEVLDNGLLEYDISALFSTQAMMTALVVTNSSDMEAMNMSAIHLALNQFGIEYSLSDTPEVRNFHWFSEFNVVREMHQLISNQIYQEGYKRHVGVLGLDGLYVSVIAETWSYAGEYNDTTLEVNVTNPFYNFTMPTEYNMLNITDRVNAVKLSFNFINDRTDEQDYKNVTLVSFFKADLYVNETGTISEYGGEDLGSALNFTYDDTVKFNSTNQLLWVEDENNNTHYVGGQNFTAMGFQSGSHQIDRYAIGDSIGLLLNITFDHMTAPIWNTTNEEFTELKGVDGIIDPGFAAAYCLNDIPYGQMVEFNGTLGLGQSSSLINARNTLNHQNTLILTNVTNYKPL